MREPFPSRGRLSQAVAAVVAAMTTVAAAAAAAVMRDRAGLLYGCVPYKTVQYVHMYAIRVCIYVHA